MSDLLVAQLFGDASEFLTGTLWVIAAIVLVSAVTMYLLGYASRFVEYLKMQESRIFDAATIDLIHRILEPFWVGLYLFAILFLASFASVEARAVLTIVNDRFAAIVWVVGWLIVATILVRALRRFGAYARGELRTKPKRITTPRLWGATELFLKYLIFGMAILIAFEGAVSLLPPTVPERAYLEGLRVNLSTPSTQLLTGVGIAIVGILIGFALARVSDSVFEDLKHRSDKHGPKVMDQFKSFTRGAIYILTLVAVLFLELSLVLSDTQMLVVAVAFLLIVGIGLLVSQDTLRNAFAGVTLMMADPYGVGDQVKIGDDLVGEVASISLTITQVLTPKGETLTLPNRTVVSMPVLNFTRSEHHAIYVDVGVNFQIPHVTVEEILLDAAKRTPGIVEDPAPRVYGKDVSGNAIVHQLLAYTKDADRMKHVKSSLLYSIQDLFHERNLKLLSADA